VNGSSTTGQDAGNQMMSAQVAISSIGSATQLDTHSVSGDGPTEILSHDVSHDVASLEAPAIVNHVVAVPALEIVHATEFATHLHL
jgi:hypothetical protein